MDCVIQETDCELMLVTAYWDDDPVCTRQALETLYKRHHQFFISVAIRHFQTWKIYGKDPVQQAGDIVAAVWVKLKDKAHSYEPCENDDADKSCSHFRAWFFSVMKNLVIDIEKKHGRHGEPRTVLSEVEEVVLQEVTSEPDVEEVDHLGVEPVYPLLAGLSDKEITVMRLLVLELGLGCVSGRLPNGVCAEIAEIVGTKEVNIRQIKKRAIQKIKNKYAELIASGGEL